MKYRFFVQFLAGVLILSGCQSQPVCPEESRPAYLTLEDIQNISTTDTSSSTSPVEMKINGKFVTVDDVVDGPLCNDSWQGTVYVGCNVQVLEWEENPLFFKDCNLSIAKGTVVYVAHHNNAPYYEGCSCHTTVEP